MKKIWSYTKVVLVVSALVGLVVLGFKIRNYFHEKSLIEQTEINVQRRIKEAQLKESIKEKDKKLDSLHKIEKHEIKVIDNISSIREFDSIHYELFGFYPVRK
jgi:hypothetical protein